MDKWKAFSMAAAPVQNEHNSHMFLQYFLLFYFWPLSMLSPTFLNTVLPVFYQKCHHKSTLIL